MLLSLAASLVLVSVLVLHLMGYPRIYFREDRVPRWVNWLTRDFDRTVSGSLLRAARSDPDAQRELTLRLGTQVAGYQRALSGAHTTRGLGRNRAEIIASLEAFLREVNRMQDEVRGR